MINIQSEKRRTERMSGADGSVTSVYHAADLNGQSVPQDYLVTGFMNGRIPFWRYQGNFVNLDTGLSPVGDDMLAKYSGTYPVVPVTTVAESRSGFSLKDVIKDGQKMSNAPNEIGNISVNPNITNPQSSSTTPSSIPVAAKGYIIPIAMAAVLGTAGVFIFHEHRVLGALAGIALGGISGMIIRSKF